MQREPMAKEDKVVATDSKTKQQVLINSIHEMHKASHEYMKAMQSSQQKLRDHWRALGLNPGQADGLLDIVGKGFTVIIERSE